MKYINRLFGKSLEDILISFTTVQEDLKEFIEVTNENINEYKTALAEQEQAHNKATQVLSKLNDFLN